MHRFARRLIATMALLHLCSCALLTQSTNEHTDIVWASPQGFDLTLDIYAPKRSSGPMPVLVVFHGGGWLLNDKDIMSDLAAGIAKRTDIITVNVNYRLLADLDNTTTVNEIVEDAMGAVLWVKANIHRYGGDPGRVAVTGDSAGGHLAAMVTSAGRNLTSNGFARAPPGFNPTYLPPGKTAEQVALEDGLRVQATILSYAGFNMLEVARGGFESEDNPFWKWAGVTARGLFGGNTKRVDHPEYYQAVSPDHYLIAAEQYTLPPQFVHVGADDLVTTPESAEAYVLQLRAMGQPVQFKVYPGKGHGYLDSGCNEYNNGCFKVLSEPAVTDMVRFLNGVFAM